MAKALPRSVTPQSGYSPGYTWMLLIAVLAMAGGSALHYLELTSDYDFESEPKGGQAVPKLTPLPPLDQPRPLTRAPIVAPDDRAELPTEPAPGLPPALGATRTRVGPTLFRVPPSLPLPGVHTR
jgi:hypothetical protein